MLRFGVVLALCHLVLAGVSNYGKFGPKNSTFEGQFPDYGQYGSSRYPSGGRQHQLQNQTQNQSTGYLASKFSHLTRTWVAGSNPRSPAGYIGGVLLDDLDHSRLPQGISVRDDVLHLPDSFDARQRWPECASLNEIRDQGCCGSAWAVSAASTMTDRWCIHSKGKDLFTFGSHDLISCCHSCGAGCNGGLPGPAWNFWVEKGVSSGGQFNSRQGCHPYPIDKCHGGEEEDTPKCLKKCQNGYKVQDTWQDRRYGRVAYSLPNDEEKIMEEIYMNGPVQAVIRIYMDLTTYKSGVYKHTWGPLAGGHALEILGWGSESGAKYWLCKNSWGESWGDRGFVKIVRGENHIGIEENIHSGLPSFKRDDSGFGYGF